MLISLPILVLQTLRADVHIAARPLAIALRDAGNAFGEDWRVDRLGSITLGVDADRASTEELRAMVARACGGTFLASGRTQTFTRTRDDRLNLRQAEKLKLSAVLHEALVTAGAYDPQQTTFKAEDLGQKAEEAERQIQQKIDTTGTFSTEPAKGLGDKLPSHAYVRRVAAGTDTMALADLYPGDRSVYSTLPNVLQHALPRAETLFADYARDLDRVRSTVKVSGLGEFASTDGTMHRRMLVRALQLISSKIPPAKLLAVFTETGAVGSNLRMSVSLEAVSSTGVTVDQSFLDLPLHLKPVVSQTLLDSTAEVTIPSDVLALADAVQTGQKPPPQGNPAALLVGKGTEPLAAFPTEILRLLASALHVKLVATLPDSFMAVLDKLPRTETVQCGVLVRAIAATETVNLQLENGWLIVTPILPGNAEREYADRDSLRRMLGETTPGRRVPFDSVAEFLLANPAATQELPMTADLARLWGSKQDFFGDTAWLRLYAAMAASRNMDETWQKRFWQMTPQELDLVRAAAFSGRLSSMDGDNIEKTEPTELLVAGLSDSGYAIWALQKNWMLTFKAPGESDCVLNVGAVAQLLKDENAAVGPPAWRRRIHDGDYASVQPPKPLRDGAFQVTLTRGIYKSVADHGLPEPGKPVASIADLPQAIRDELKARSG